MYDVGCTMYDCDYSALCAGIFAKQVRTRVDEAVRGVWRRFRGCFSCWVVVQSDRRFGKIRQNNMKKTVMYTLATSPLLVEWVIESLFLMYQLLL